MLMLLTILILTMVAVKGPVDQSSESFACNYFLE